MPRDVQNLSRDQQTATALEQEVWRALKAEQMRHADMVESPGLAFSRDDFLVQVEVTGNHVKLVLDSRDNNEKDLDAQLSRGMSATDTIETIEKDLLRFYEPKEELREKRGPAGLGVLHPGIRCEKLGEEEVKAFPFQDPPNTCYVGKLADFVTALNAIFCRHGEDPITNATLIHEAKYRA